MKVFCFRKIIIVLLISLLCVKQAFYSKALSVKFFSSKLCDDDH